MNLRIFDSGEDLVAAAAAAIAQRATPGAAIALSGGNTPAPLYTILGRNEALRSIELEWVEVDERYVPLNDPRSNAAMIERTLFASGIAPAHRFLRFATEAGNPEAAATEFERQWRADGVDRLDTVILGVGDDGHTASLFPGTAALDVTGRIATAVFVDKLDMWRLTITLPVIRAAALRIVLAEGVAKQSVIRQAREGADLPIVRATGGDIQTWWFVDRAAAGA